MPSPGVRLSVTFVSCAKTNKDIIVVFRELLLYVFLQKLLHYLNKFTNRGLSAELLVFSVFIKCIYLY